MSHTSKYFLLPPAITFLMIYKVPSSVSQSSQISFPNVQRSRSFFGGNVCLHFLHFILSKQHRIQIRGQSHSTPLHFSQHGKQLSHTASIAPSKGHTSASAPRTLRVAAVLRRSDSTLAHGLLAARWSFFGDVINLGHTEECCYTRDPF